MISDDATARIKTIDLETFSEADETYVDRLLSLAQKRWAKFAGPKAVVPTVAIPTPKFDLNLRKFNYDGFAESLLAIYNSNSLNDVRDGEVNLPPIMKVAHSLKSLHDIMIYVLRLRQ